MNIICFTLDYIKITDLPRPTFEEFSKAVKKKIKDREVEIQVKTSLNILVEDQLTDVNNELEQLREALQTCEKGSG